MKLHLNLVLVANLPIVPVSSLRIGLKKQQAAPVAPQPLQVTVPAGLPQQAAPVAPQPLQVLVPAGLPRGPPASPPGPPPQAPFQGPPVPPPEPSLPEAAGPAGRRLWSKLRDEVFSGPPAGPGPRSVPSLPGSRAAMKRKLKKMKTRDTLSVSQPPRQPWEELPGEANSQEYIDYHIKKNHPNFKMGRLLFSVLDPYEYKRRNRLSIRTPGGPEQYLPALNDEPQEIENYHFSQIPSSPILKWDQGILVDTHVCKPILIGRVDLGIDDKVNRLVNEFLDKFKKDDSESLKDVSSPVGDVTFINFLTSLGNELEKDVADAPSDLEELATADGVVGGDLSPGRKKFLEAKQSLAKVAKTSFKKTRTVDELQGNHNYNVGNFPYLHEISRHNNNLLKRITNMADLLGIGGVTEQSVKTYYSASGRNLDQNLKRLEIYVKDWYIDLWRMAAIFLGLEYILKENRLLFLPQDSIREMFVKLQTKYVRIIDSEEGSPSASIDERFRWWIDMAYEHYETKRQTSPNHQKNFPSTAEEALHEFALIEYRRQQREVKKDMESKKVRDIGHHISELQIQRDQQRSVVNNEILVPFCPKDGVVAFFQPERSALVKCFYENQNQTFKKWSDEIRDQWKPISKEYDEAIERKKNISEEWDNLMEEGSTKREGIEGDIPLGELEYMIGYPLWPDEIPDKYKEDSKDKPADWEDWRSRAKNYYDRFQNLDSRRKQVDDDIKLHDKPERKNFDRPLNVRNTMGCKGSTSTVCQLVIKWIEEDHNDSKCFKNHSTPETKEKDVEEVFMAWDRYDGWYHILRDLPESALTDYTWLQNNISHNGKQGEEREINIIDADLSIEKLTRPDNGPYKNVADIPLLSGTESSMKGWEKWIGKEVGWGNWIGKADFNQFFLKFKHNHPFSVEKSVREGNKDSYPNMTNLICPHAKTDWHIDSIQKQVMLNPLAEGDIVKCLQGHRR